MQRMNLEEYSRKASTRMRVWFKPSKTEYLNEENIIN